MFNGGKKIVIMKKNTINAFAEKKVALDNVSGGGYFEPTCLNGSPTVNDGHYVTEKGEQNQLGDIATYNQYDADLCVHERSVASPVDRLRISASETLISSRSF